MLVKSLLLWSLFWSAPRMENNLFSPCLCNDHGSYWALLHLGLHLESWSAGICRPTCFLHKVNKRYFESLVHFGVASQNRKAGICFKKWKWFGGRRHISSLVSSLRLENRSGAWGGGGGKGVVERKAHVPMIVPRSIREKLSGAGSSAKVKGEKRNKSPDPQHNFTRSFIPYVFHTRHLCTMLCSDLGKSLPSRNLGESQEGNMQFLQFALGLDCWICILTLVKHYCPRTLRRTQH